VLEETGYGIDTTPFWDVEYTVYLDTEASNFSVNESPSVDFGSCREVEDWGNDWENDEDIDSA
jgi:hypothetical protein